MPRPSATASAKFAKITVNHSHTVIAAVNQSLNQAIGLGFGAPDKMLPSVVEAQAQLNGVDLTPAR